ncbi:MAG: cytochrome c, class [Deltaproteobacteria bacterium]|nr:cytochrome c, class [Deltaproteobacteria bacterium]
MSRIKIISNGLVLILLFALAPFAFGQAIPEDPTKGGQLFVSKGCAKCHALKGEEGKVGPDLSKIDLGGTQLNLAAKIWNHAPSMIIRMESAEMIKPTLTGQDFAEISAYLYFLRFLDERGDPTKGRSVYAEKGCSLCHPSSGKGKEGALGLDGFPKNVSPVFLSQAIWNHCLDMIVRMVEIGMKWPKFWDKEMMDLLEYIKTNAKGAEEIAFSKPPNPKEGKQIFASKECFQCHSIRGEGARGGVDLAETAEVFYTSLTQIASSLWNKGPTVLVRIAQSQCGLPRFTSKEMADLLAYLYFLHFMDPPGNRTNGEKIFSTIGCSQCHGPDKKSGKLMYIDLSKYEATAEMEIVASMWNHSKEIQKAVGKQNVPWPRFEDGEMADLLEFIRTPKKK